MINKLAWMPLVLLALAGSIMLLTSLTSLDYPIDADEPDTPLAPLVITATNDSITMIYSDITSLEEAKNNVWVIQAGGRLVFCYEEEEAVAVTWTNGINVEYYTTNNVTEAAKAFFGHVKGFIEQHYDIVPKAPKVKKELGLLAPLAAPRVETVDVSQWTTTLEYKVPTVKVYQCPVHGRVYLVRIIDDECYCEACVWDIILKHTGITE